MRTLERMMVYASGESFGSRVVGFVGCLPLLGAVFGTGR